MNWQPGNAQNDGIMKGFGDEEGNELCMEVYVATFPLSKGSASIAWMLRGHFTGVSLTLAPKNHRVMAFIQYSAASK